MYIQEVSSNEMKEARNNPKIWKKSENTSEDNNEKSPLFGNRGFQVKWWLCALWRI